MLKSDLRFKQGNTLTLVASVRCWADAGEDAVLRTTGAPVPAAGLKAGTQLVDIQLASGANEVCLAAVADVAPDSVHALSAILTLVASIRALVCISEFFFDPVNSHL